VASALSPSMLTSSSPLKKSHGEPTLTSSSDGAVLPNRNTRHQASLPKQATNKYGTSNKETLSSTIASFNPGSSHSGLVPLEPSRPKRFQEPTTSVDLVVATRSIPATRFDSHEDSEENEFLRVKLRKNSPKEVERHIKESKLQFAEMVANALTRRGSTNESKLEALRHIDDLKHQIADLQSDEEATMSAINKLRSELIDMFNQGCPMQEGYLLKWIMPLNRERDPKTGQLIMNADQVALLQSFESSEDISMVSGLGMVRSVLQSNFKAMNGLRCLQDIHDYAAFRLGKKPKRAPQNPWNLLAELFETAQHDDSTEDIHQRVCNALVQWVVREILGSTSNSLSSRSCFHAIFLIASLKLEVQRLAPLALEQATVATNTIKNGDDRSIHH
jgi:chaperonin cofactor prefoldin